MKRIKLERTRTAADENEFPCEKRRPWRGEGESTFRAANGFGTVIKVEERQRHYVSNKGRLFNVCPLRQSERSVARWSHPV